MNNFEVIIGIENHVELKTKTKLFSPGTAIFGNEPNTCVNERDIAFPGTLPTLNKKAVELAILAANAFNMEIDTNLKFDRKNYYYSDLPKGYQITQQFHPIGKNGFIGIKINNKFKKINIERLHIEEDTAKQLHIDKTFIDYNRSGIGLIEIVSKPELRSADEAVAYIEELRQILLFLNVSDVKMSEGSLRCDVNISIRPIGSDIFGKRVEVKNLNSLSNVKKAINFEVERQKKLVLQNIDVKQETMRFDESTQETVAIRSKEDALDYKYFRDPNIPNIKLDKNWVKKIIENSPELACEKRKRYSEIYKLSNDEINYLFQDLDFVTYFEECVNLGIDPKKIANIIINDIKDILNKKMISISKIYLKPNDLNLLTKYLNDGLISTKHFKNILQIKCDNNMDINEIMTINNFKIISDEKIINNLIDKLIIEQENFILNEYNDRPQRVEKTLMGMLMKETSGNVNPEIGMKILLKLINKLIQKKSK